MPTYDITKYCKSVNYYFFKISWEQEEIHSISISIHFNSFLFRMECLVNIIYIASYMYIYLLNVNIYNPRHCFTVRDSHLKLSLNDSPSIDYVRFVFKCLDTWVENTMYTSHYKRHAIISLPLFVKQKIKTFAGHTVYIYVYHPFSIKCQCQNALY